MREQEVMNTNQYLTLTLDNEIFAVNITRVREVLEFSTITKVPRTPEFLRGVINLRGSVVPVVDMRLKFGLAKTEKTIDTSIVIVEAAFDGDDMILGALVDTVQEVLEIPEDQIEPAPKLGARLNTEFIKGMGKKDDRFVIILDIDKVLSATELDIMKETGKRALNLQQEENPVMENQMHKKPLS